MKVRLRDFAEIHRISERTVQVHIKNNEAELEGHVDRRGKQGTWLDEFAVEFLLDRIQLPTKDEILVPTPREAALMGQLSEAHRKLADAERRAGENAEAAGKVFFLEANNEAQAARIEELSREVGEVSQKCSEAEEKAQRAQKRFSEYAAEVAAYNALPWLKRFGRPAPVPPDLMEE